MWYTLTSKKKEVLVLSTVKTTRLSTKGQVVIPADIRKELDMNETDELIVTRVKDRIIMRKLHIGDILEEAQQASENNQTVSHEEMKKKYGI